MAAGDKGAALEAMMTPMGSPSVGKVQVLGAPPSEVEPDESAANTIEMQDVIMEFKQTQDPKTAVDLFMRLYDMAKRQD